MNGNPDPLSLPERQTSLKSQMITLQNEFEIELLMKDRQVSLIDKKYRETLEELEQSIADTKHLYESNGHLEKELAAAREELAKLKKAEVSNKATFDREISSRNRQFEQVRSDAETKYSEIKHQHQNVIVELNGTKSTLKRYEEELNSQNEEIKRIKQSCSAKDDEIATLKASRVVMAHHNYSTEELEELTTLNTLLAEQVNFGKSLEKANLEQASELKRLRAAQESQRFLKSENERLRTKVEEISELESRNEELQLENINLKSALTSWEVYDSNNADGVSLPPEEIMRDWRLFKQENVKLIDQNSRLELDLNNMKILNDELALERNQLLDLNKSYETSILNLKKLNYEIEQHKMLSFEECKILRRQLDDMASALDVDKFKNQDETSKDQVESLVQVYKNKTQDLTNELKKLNEELLEQQEMFPAKRRKTSDDVALNYSQRLNELKLENVALVRKLESSSETCIMLESKLKKIEGLHDKKIRILQLRNSPFLQDQLVKKKQLTLLRQENEVLLSENFNETNSFPKSVYERLKFENNQLETDIHNYNKKITRLREVFNRKSLEFIEAVNSLLGFKLEFLPHSKIKMTSCYNSERFLTADLAKNTLTSNLDAEVEDWQNLFKDFVIEKGQIPCFLASLTLKLWERTQ
ncbi:LAMI_0D10176g1_1 [Lachancea mirantina]|uniref:Spindle assembly checkpoint component MAD1 n=1 Tax=Lachancea mirantina TaxID=1230905 RepID=A0A1G4JE78_9SACH|nr:LAMI_0D10176g1_1 [Lachancea mirantina]